MSLFYQCKIDLREDLLRSPNGIRAYGSERECDIEDREFHIRP